MINYNSVVLDYNSGEFYTTKTVFDIAQVLTRPAF